MLSKADLRNIEIVDVAGYVFAAPPSTCADGRGQRGVLNVLYFLPHLPMDPTLEPTISDSKRAHPTSLCATRLRRYRNGSRHAQPDPDAILSCTGVRLDHRITFHRDDACMVAI